MTQSNQTLQKVLSNIRENTKKGLKTLVVFDLDSTLFDVGPRLQRILLEFGEDPAHQKRFPDQVRYFNKLKVERSDWGVKDALIRSGLDGTHPDFQRAIRDFWRERFFSNSYLHYDVPYPGAVEYVKQVADAGAEISYLTGRDVARMGQGSAEVLLKWKFPLGGSATLDLKPDKEMDDAAFKTDWFLELPEGKYADIWFFENEPVNINKMRVEAEHVKIVFLDTTHSRQEKEPEDIPRILHFLLED